MLGAAAALVLGAPQQQPGSTPLDPASDAFVAEFATTTGGSTLGTGTTSPLERSSLTSTASVTTFVPVLGRASLSIGGERSTR